MLVSSVPLSETHIDGRPRWAMTASSSRATRMPESEVSADQAQALAREVIDHGEDAEPPAVGERIAHEVERPALIRALRQRHRRPRAQRSLASATAADLKALLPIEPAQLLVVHVRALAAEQDVEPAIAEAAALGGQLA